MRKISWAGGNITSYTQAQKALEELADLDIDAKEISRITDRIGQEMLLARNHTEFYKSPEIPKVPVAAAISVDGGRVQTRAEHQPPGVYQPEWKETKVVHIEILDSKTYKNDPHPNVPACFLDHNHVQALTNALGSQCKKTEHIKPTTNKKSKPYKKDNVLLKSCVASMLPAEEFASILRDEVQLLGIENASKKVFIGDGGAANWLIHEKFFAHWTPLLDFTHLVQHLYSAASAICKLHNDAWKLYLKLVTHAWNGNPQLVLNSLKYQQSIIGTPNQHSPDNDPKRILDKTINYIQNNQNRMDYPKIRKLGLPTSSSKVESLIKQVNLRVKASDKFWITPKLEAILQIKAAELSTTNKWNTFWHKKKQLLMENNFVFLNKAA